MSELFLAELREYYADAKPYSEGGNLYVHLPTAAMPSGEVGEVLLWLNGADPYPTRLFFSKEQGGGVPWTQHLILAKVWFTWSWKDVPSNLSYLAILLSHFRAFKWK